MLHCKKAPKLFLRAPAIIRAAPGATARAKNLPVAAQKGYSATSACVRRVGIQGWSMFSGLLALVFSSAFAGAALYVNLVEQPARLTLDDSSMMREWAPSDRRGFALLGGLALLAAIAGLVAFGQGGDIRWLIGALIVLASWPYTYFVIVPLNNRLLATSAAQPEADAREIVTVWGQLEWGLFALGAISAGVFAWTLN
jgi:hypothetical protein